MSWMLRHASVAGSLEHLAPTVDQLRVAGGCNCGCLSIDFKPDGQAGSIGRLADAIGRTSGGIQVGLILRGRQDAVTGLEVYDLDAAPATHPPTLASLQADRPNG